MLIGIVSGVLSAAQTAVNKIVGKFLTKKTPKVPKVKKPKSVSKEVSEDFLKEIEKNLIKNLGDIIEEDKREEELRKEREEAYEEVLAKDTIETLIEKIKEMDGSGYTPYSPHEWSINPEKAVNSKGAGKAKEDSGNGIIDLIRDAVAEVGEVTVARSLEQYWDGILYQIERLEFAIYDAEYRKRSGGRAAYEAAKLKLEWMLKIGSDEEVEGKYIDYSTVE